MVPSHSFHFHLFHHSPLLSTSPFLSFPRISYFMAFSNSLHFSPFTSFSSFSFSHCSLVQSFLSFPQFFFTFLFLSLSSTPLFISHSLISSSPLQYTTKLKTMKSHALTQKNQSCYTH